MTVIIDYGVGNLFSLKSSLAALGLEGPAIGAALERMVDAVIDGRTPNEKEQLLKML